MSKAKIVPITTDPVVSLRALLAEHLEWSERFLDRLRCEKAQPQYPHSANPTREDLPLGAPSFRVLQGGLRRSKARRRPRR